MPSDDIAPMSAHGAGERRDGDKKLGLAGESGASITASRRITATATTTRGTEVSQRPLNMAAFGQSTDKQEAAMVVSTREWMQ